MFNYKVEVDFDDRYADRTSMTIYFGVLGKYKAMGIGHEKTGTSTLFFLSEKKVSLEQLAVDLSDIEILNFREFRFDDTSIT